MAVKPDFWIEHFGNEGGIYPFNPNHVNPASYDVTLDNHWICPTRDPEEVISDEVTLFPGEVILATTFETICLPRDVVATLHLKSTLGRLFLNHSLSGWIDPNFQGQITLELQNLGPYPRKLTKGQRVAQIVFMGMEAPPRVAYGEKSTDHYNNQKGTTRAWSEDFFPKK